MNAPFYKFGFFGDEVSLIVAFVIGLAFGFCLERAGFGNARVLAAQFYFRDLRVLKVMFTAIITAMVGLFGLAWLGLVDLSLVYLTPTYLGPQIVGGLILGAGFIIGGYCPGTSCVSAATGRIDGMVYLAGMLGGLLGFAEVYPFIEHLVHLTPLGQVTLAQLWNVPYGLLVLAVVLLALGAFLAAEWAESRFGGRTPGRGALLEPVRRLTPVRRFALGLVVLGAGAALIGNPYRTEIGGIDTRELALEAGRAEDHVRVEQLADWLVEGRTDFLLVDLRDPDEYAQYHVPGAVNVPLATLSPEFAPRNERIVLYSDGGIHAAQAWMLLRALDYPAVYQLLGGLEEWKSTILYPVAPAPDAPAIEHVNFARRAAIARHFGGTPQDAGASGPTLQPAAPLPPPPAPAPVRPAGATRKKKEGC